MEKKYFKLFKLSSTILIFVLICQSCGEDVKSPFKNFSLEEINNEDLEYIEDFHSKYFPSVNLEKPKNNPAVYVDFSDGITKYSLSNDNNKEVFKTLFRTAANYTTTEYFELRSDSLIPYIGKTKIAYFSKDGHKDANGEFFMGAPIDKAINSIVEKDNVGVLITDGELYDQETGRVSAEMWASEAFKKWMNKGNEIAIVYTDFQETNEGKTYDKHMYVMFFIPASSDNSTFLDRYLKDLKSDGLKFDLLRFSTNTNGLYTRDYRGNEFPGSSKAIEYEALNESFSGKKMFLKAENMEFIDFTGLDLSFSEESGLIYFVRDLGDEKTGKPRSYPLLDSLYFKFSSLPNYKVNNLKIVLHDVFDDFKSYKVNEIARENLPEIEKTINGDTAKSMGNYLLFQGMSTIDGKNPYDTSKVTVDKIENDFLPMLKKEFEFKQSIFSTKSKGIQDFLVLDQKAGKISEINKRGYEILIKFDDKLNKSNSQLSSERYNLVRVDIVIDTVETKPIDKKALTWTKIDDGETDVALYGSLESIMDINNVKPQDRIIYSYYLKFNAFKKD